MRARQGSGSSLMRSQPEPYCYFCGVEGRVRYTDLPDRIFHTPGSWTIKECQTCRLLWLDPMPVEADIGKAYENYYTHADYPSVASTATAASRPRLLLRRVFRRLTRTVLVPAINRISVDKQGRDAMYLQHHRPGRLLDVGCGRGVWLRYFKDRGWHVAGQDMDPRAAEELRREGDVPVYIGPLETAPYSQESFDAVIMSHVIEHVHDPIGLVRTSGGFLNPGGVLIAITPNTASSLHRRFGADWLGLDPPRHLRLFNTRTLQYVAEQAGFRRTRTWTTPARVSHYALECRRLQRARTARDGVPFRLSPYGTEPPFALAPWVFWQQYLASTRAIVDPNAGDECVLRAVK